MGRLWSLAHGLLMDGRQWRKVVEELRGMCAILAEFLERLDLREVTLCFNDWRGAQVMVADGPMDRVGKLALVSCEAFENYPPALASFDRPVPVVWDLEGEMMPTEHGRRLAQAFPDSRLVELPDCYTLIPEDRRAELAGAIRDFAG